jgi:hypothetical protein
MQFFKEEKKAETIFNFFRNVCSDASACFTGIMLFFF